MFTRSTSSLSKPLSAVFAALALGTAALPVLADDAAPVSRQQVREELRMWKATNMLSQSGEITEPPAVLEAREAFYSLQTDVLQEENRVVLAQRLQQQLAQDASSDAAAVAFTDAE